MLFRGEMEDKRVSTLMKYVRGEISFAEWIESGVGAGDAEQDDNSMQVDGDGEEEMQAQMVEASNSQVNPAISQGNNETPGIITVLVSDPIFARLAEIGSIDSAEAGTSISEEQLPTTDIDLNSDMSNLLPTKKSQAPVKMTDLLLQRSGAKSAKKHGGTGVDEFMEEIPMQKQRRSTRRKLFELPPKLKQTMGHANILWARGEIEQAKGICMELIRQVPKCSEPFQTLGMMYEEQGDQDKALQFFLIAAYLSKSDDVEEWLKLTMMSLEQDNFAQALTCYNQALKLEPANVNILLDKAALYYQMGELKKALECYEAALKAVPEDDGAKYIDLSCEMAKLYHEINASDEVIKVLQAAFAKYPSHVTNQAVNMLADLLMTSKAYEPALQMISKYCNIKKEIIAEFPGESPLTSFTQLQSPGQETNTATSPEEGRAESSVKWIVPDDLPIDLRVKIAVCLIHVRQLRPVKEILAPLFSEPVEAVGDLYIDVGEAYAENGDWEQALPIFDMLVKTDNYCMAAAVWLKKGECLSSLGRLEEAALAYARVVNLAPNHLDARLFLASLHQQLGRPNQALDVLSDPRGIEGAVDSTEEDVAMDTSSVQSEGSEREPAVQPQDFRLLFHKCALLHSQNRIDEFLEAGIEMFRLFFIDVYYLKDLADIALKSTRLQKEMKQKEASEHEEPRSRASIAAASSSGDTGLRIEEWWEMFKNVVTNLSRLKRHSEALHLMLCALSSDRFSESYQTELVFMSIVALYLAREYKIAFDATKILIARDRQNPVLWNILSRITAKSGDSRHTRYILRLLIKNPDEFPLVMYSGHNALVSGSYRFAIGEYVRAFRQKPDDPFISLCLGLQYIHLACQRFPRNRHSCVVQGVVFLFQYLGLRGECQEAFYNIGRAFHQLGLLQFAIHYYNKALEFPLHEASKTTGDKTVKFSEKHDLHREAAFNLSLIYRASGNEVVAKELLMTHCWI